MIPHFWVGTKFNICTEIKDSEYQNFRGLETGEESAKRLKCHGSGLGQVTKCLITIFSTEGGPVGIKEDAIAQSSFSRKKTTSWTLNKIRWQWAAAIAIQTWLITLGNGTPRIIPTLVTPALRPSFERILDTVNLSDQETVPFQDASFCLGKCGGFKISDILQLRNYVLVKVKLVPEFLNRHLFPEWMRWRQERRFWGLLSDGRRTTLTSSGKWPWPTSSSSWEDENQLLKTMKLIGEPSPSPIPILMLASLILGSIKMRPPSPPSPPRSSLIAASAPGPPSPPSRNVNSIAVRMYCCPYLSAYW